MKATAGLRSRWRRLLGVSLAVTALAASGCAGRPGPEVLTTVAAPTAAGRHVTVYSATTRARRSPETNVFTAQRAAETNFARFAISLPPDHRHAAIEWPARMPPDPNTSFAVVDQAVLARSDFYHQIRAEEVVPQHSRRVGLFVHGYNFGYEEALFRLAQLASDAEIDGVPILFAWPSEGTVTGYVADRDSVTYSRDQLVDLLTQLTAGRGKGEVVVFAHSLGCWLTMEALRQLRLTGRGDVLDRLEVIFAAPDIDADVFRQQLGIVGRMTTPMTILVSKGDHALDVVNLLTGHQRVGELDVADPRVDTAARAAGIRVVDITALPGTDALNHDRYIALAALYPTLTARPSEAGGLNRVGATIFDATGNVLASPFRLVGRTIAPD